MMMALELLRPFVEANAWDYCIVWQFGDDPSRYIKWIGCCCNGRQGVCRNVKEEIDAENQNYPDLCRDTYIKHTVITKTCEKLALIPFYLPLYSGVHGEVAMSGQPSWSHDNIGTQVLIPVNGGLIELYMSKQVLRDEEMMYTLMAQFNMFCQQMAVHLKTESSPNGSYPWSEHSSLVSAGSTHVSPTESIETPIKWLGTKTRQKTGKEKHQSKNLMTERNRRNRIKDGLFALRALVPKISKMDRAAIVGDAIEFINELKTNVQELQDELNNLENDESEVCKPKRSREHSPTRRNSQISTASNRKTEVQVEVHEIEANEFLIKLICGQKRGVFQRIMEIIDSLGLQVLDVNVTTCYGRVLNILKVEAKVKDVEAKSLKESLLNSWMLSMTKMPQEAVNAETMNREIPKLEIV